MTTALMPEGRQRYFNNDGSVAAGCKLYTYAAGTLTPKTTYSDAAGAVPNTNPVTLDAKGEAVIFWDGAYKVDLKTAAGAQITGYPVDGYNTDPAGLWSLITATGASMVGFLQAGAGAVLRTVQAKLRDTLGAKDYNGVTGDGITDNRNALNTMFANLASGFGVCEVEFPRGDYLINSNLTVPTGITLRFHAGARLVIANAVTVTFTGTDVKAGRHQIFSCTGTGKVAGTIRNDLIFPEWWGAIADGLHPPVGADFSDRAAAAARNAPALQAALTFAGNQYAVNGLTGTVSLTYGFYVYDTTLSIPLSANLIGYGIGSALFYYKGTGNAVESISTNNSLIADIFIAPIAGPTWNESTGYGLYMNGVSTPCVRNVWSSGFIGGTFFFQSVIEGRLHGLISDNSHGPAFTIRGVGQGTVLENCLTAGTTGGSCFDISGYDWHLIGCTAKDGATGVNGYYLNACENINMTACGVHDSAKEGILLTASALNCTLTGCFVNGASTVSSGTYGAMNISGTRNKLIAPKVTQNAPTYSYALILGGGGTDCSFVEGNFVAGTVGTILDGQPTGSITTKVPKVSTTDATPTNIWAKALNNNAGVLLEAMVVAKQRGNAASSIYKFWVHATTGSVSTVLASGPTSVYSYESDALLNATFVLTSGAANAGVVSLQITGLAAGQPIDWEATVTAISITG